MAEPLGSRLRPARRSGLTSPRPGPPPHARQGHATASPRSRNPDKPQNRQRQAKHALKAPIDENSSHEINRWIEAKGQPGVTMQLSGSPDRVVRHEPACCSGCAAGLGSAPEEGVIRRQVTEIPEVRAEVTEHRVIGRRCGCGAVTWEKHRPG